MARRNTVVVKRSSSGRSRSRDIITRILNCATKVVRKPVSLLMVGLAVLFISNPATLDQALNTVRSYIGDNSITEWLNAHKPSLPGTLLFGALATAAAPRRDHFVLYLIMALFTTYQTISEQQGLMFGGMALLFYCTRGYEKLVPIILAYSYFKNHDLLGPHG